MKRAYSRLLVEHLLGGASATYDANGYVFDRLRRQLFDFPELDSLDSVTKARIAIDYYLIMGV